ncbi:Imidazolonepropionase [Bizionia echini]|uniref:Imidazolonepropionase n=1 Tax=Bizionia echini TaxID=649333 RepID=A0A1I4ZCL3_9FLAO|nr:amidohydrolase family protein [Bizionia echini]SFN47630.1 Imidazolonepropionase [Bizionia echini]
MKNLFKGLLLVILVTMSLNSFAQEEEMSYVLITNATIFDGVNEKLMSDTDVLIENNLIKEIGKNLKAPKGAEIIDVSGTTLIPGFSDAHSHITLNDELEYIIYSSQEGYMGALAARNAEEMLQRGFTTIRDTGGPALGIKKAIDDGLLPGPRILPSGAMVTQTSGHGDYDSRETRYSYHYTGQMDMAYLRGWSITADGVAEVQKATREVLRSGATQIKIMGSGSVLGAHDPIDVTEYTLDELKAIVKEAEHWGTYTLIHAYTDQGVRNALEAGVQSIEHGLFVTEETMRMIKEKDAFFSTQFLAFTSTPEEAGIKKMYYPKFLQANAGARNGYELAKKVGVKMPFGTDMLGGLETAAYQSQEFTARAEYFSGYEILVQATSLNAELFERSGKRHPYQEGPLGVIKVGAYADVLAVDGNPLEDISLLANPSKNLLLIMKDGKVYKNTLKQ